MQQVLSCNGRSLPVTVFRFPTLIVKKCPFWQAKWFFDHILSRFSKIWNPVTQSFELEVQVQHLYRNCTEVFPILVTQYPSCLPTWGIHFHSIPIGLGWSSKKASTRLVLKWLTFDISRQEHHALLLQVVSHHFFCPHVLQEHNEYHLKRWLAPLKTWLQLLFLNYSPPREGKVPLG